MNALNKFLLTAAAGLFVTGFTASAQTDTVTVDGSTYTITLVLTSFNASSALLESQPWYVSDGGATALAAGTAVGTTFSAANGNNGLYFAYAFGAGTVDYVLPPKTFNGPMGPFTFPAQYRTANGTDVDDYAVVAAPEPALYGGLAAGTCLLVCWRTRCTTALVQA